MMKKLLVTLSMLMTVFAQQEKAKPEIHGALTAKYHLQSEKSDGDSFLDQDVSADTFLDAVFSPVFEFHYSGTARFNFNQNSGELLWNPFENIADAQKNPLYYGYIYEAYAEVHQSTEAANRIRIGRQTQNRAKAAVFDGVDAGIKIGKILRAEIYGGISPLFDARDITYGSAWLAGAGLDAAFKNKALLNLDYFFSSDKGNAEKILYQENYLSLKYRQHWSDSLDSTAAFSLLDFAPYEAKVKLRGDFIKTGTAADILFVSRFESQAAYSAEFSAFYKVIGTNHPYWRADVSLRQSLGKIFSLDAGFLARQLWNKNDDSYFNRSFLKVSGGADAEFFERHLLIAVMNEFWSSDEGNHYALCFDASYKIAAWHKGRDSAKVSLSSSFDRYKYDEFETYGERANVQTYSFKLHAPLLTGLSMNALYAFETGLDPVHSVKASVKYEF